MNFNMNARHERLSSDGAQRPPSAHTQPDRVRDMAVGAAIGLIAGVVGITVGLLVAAFVNDRSSPMLAVGEAAIDGAPEWLKGWAIRTFGSNDKTALLLGIGLVLGLGAAALGVASMRRLWIGMVGLVGLSLVGVAAALSRPTGGPADILPTVVGAIAAGAVFLLLRRAARPASGAGTDPARGGFDRRRLLLTGVAAVATAVVAGGLAGVITRRLRASAARSEVRIPTPASPAPTLAGSDLGLRGVEPFFTPNEQFYRVDTTLLAPAVDVDHWALRVHGMVERPFTLDYEELLVRPLIERDITLACVSNPVGGPYVGNARWVGAPLRDLLDRAGIQAGADQIVTRSVDGFTVGTPTEIATDGRDAMLAIAMNGQALPFDHGFPVRMIVPGLYGYVSATKWLVEIELTTFDAFDPYWVQRGWAKRAPIKTMSRIDVPVASSDLPAGPRRIAGVAWAQHRGIERVEVRVDQDPWIDTDLGAVASADTWRQWVVDWIATPGTHTLQARATDGTGRTQDADRVPPFPDGATGYHTIVVHVT